MGSYKWVVISPLIGVITIVTLIITPLISTHEPPSMDCGSVRFRFRVERLGFRFDGFGFEGSAV